MFEKALRVYAPLLVRVAKRIPEEVITIDKEAPVWDTCYEKLMSLTEKDWCFIGLVPEKGRCMISGTLACGN